MLHAQNEHQQHHGEPLPTRAAQAFQAPDTRQESRPCVTDAKWRTREETNHATGACKQNLYESESTPDAHPQ